MMIRNLMLNDSCYDDVVAWHFNVKVAYEARDIRFGARIPAAISRGARSQ
jgi:hypothetical protein